MREKTVNVKSPLQKKDFDVGGNIGIFEGHASKVDVFNNSMIILNLKIGEAVAVFDKNSVFWELSKDRNGHLHLRKLQKNRLSVRKASI